MSVPIDVSISNQNENMLTLQVGKGRLAAHKACADGGDGAGSSASSESSAQGGSCAKNERHGVVGVRLLK